MSTFEHIGFAGPLSVLPCIPVWGLCGVLSLWGAAGCGHSHAPDPSPEPSADAPAAQDGAAPLDAGRPAPPRDHAMGDDAGDPRERMADGALSSHAPGPLGATCESHADCSVSSICYELGTHGMCTRLCEEDADCPGGEACLHWGDAQVCMPRCDTSERQCAGELACVIVESEDGEEAGLCLPPCNGNADCAEGAECVVDEDSGRHVCVPHEDNGGWESPHRTCRYWRWGGCW